MNDRLYKVLTIAYNFYTNVETLVKGEKNMDQNQANEENTILESPLLSDLPRLKRELEKNLVKLLSEFINTTGLEVLRIDIEHFRPIGLEQHSFQRISVVVGME